MNNTNGSSLCIALRFGGERSRNGSSYSSGVLSYAVANLPIHLRYVFHSFMANRHKSDPANYALDRYNPENLLVVALSPGPSESSCDELQHLLEAVVDDKIRLYVEGIMVKTNKYPDGESF